MLAINPSLQSSAVNILSTTGEWRGWFFFIFIFCKSGCPVVEWHRFDDYTYCKRPYDYKGSMYWWKTKLKLGHVTLFTWLSCHALFSPFIVFWLRKKTYFKWKNKNFDDLGNLLDFKIIKIWEILLFNQKMYKIYFFFFT